MFTALMYLIVLAALGGGGWFAWQRFGAGAFGTGEDQRIGVTEVVSVDNKRKLVLIHRDGVEHLIMTGGPIDVVIEQGILPQRRPAAAQQPAAAQPHYEPRFSAPQANLAADPAAGDAQPGNFGRLRQRPAASPGAEPLQRGDAPGFASGGNR
jgi:Flagellar biosynthesis protein, FliO